MNECENMNLLLLMLPMYPWREAELTGVRRPSRPINVNASKGPGSDLEYTTRRKKYETQI
jgi:hypothetical protein